MCYQSEIKGKTPQNMTATKMSDYRRKKLIYFTIAAQKQLIDITI
jgi:hypothetical protein